MSEENAGGTVETPTVEELSQKLESEKAARLKAEAKIVDMKKSTKETKKKEPEVKGDFITKEDFIKLKAEEDFFTENKELVEHKETLQELVSKGNSWEDAKFLLEKKDPTIANRKIAKKTNFTTGEPLSTDKTTYTMDELKDLPQHEYNTVMSLKEQGKVVIT